MGCPALEEAGKGLVGGGEESDNGFDFNTDPISHILESLEEEFKSFTESDKLESWVENLVVKKQPGENMPRLTTLKKGQVVRYMFQKTAQKTEVTLRGQKFIEPWLLVQLGDSSMGWVHGGGVNFVHEFPPLPIIGQTTEEDNSTQERSLNGNNARKKTKNTSGSDWKIIPGKRIGPIRLNTSESDLVQLFGRGNISHGEISVPGKGDLLCTTLMGGTPNALHITWKNQGRTQIKAVYLSAPQSNWHILDGIRVGMPLPELVKSNGAPLSFYGFHWDYSGTISSWKSGRLKPYENHFFVMLDYKVPKDYQYVADKFKGDAVFSSNTEDIDKLFIQVRMIGVYLD